jgi:pseudouridylate synthase I
LEYDGTNYAGWQRQKNAVTIQGKIEEAIYAISNEKVNLVGCSRTDSGVHARYFVANYNTNSTHEIYKLIGGINHKLPDDIVVLNGYEEDENFHSRYNCKGKTYSYTILNRSEPCAIYRNYVHRVQKRLDDEKMQRAAQYLIGTNDFSAFKNIGSSVKTSVRTITQLDVVRENDIIKVIASADGFLYNMVRIITGTLINVGFGKIEPEKIIEILKSNDRTKAGKAVPPQGLCLEKVYY